MGKGKLLAFGVWPEVSLTEACKKRNEAKLILKSVNDPSVDKKNQKLTGHILQNNNFGFLLRLVTPSPVIVPTNSSQSDTLHNNIYKEQGKDPFYSDFVLRSIFTILWPCTLITFACFVPNLFPPRTLRN